MVKSGQVWTGLFPAVDATGALSTPSVGPAGTLYVNGVANGASVTISGSNPYKFSVTLPTLAAGDTVSMYVTGTINLIPTADVVAEDVADTKIVSDLHDSAYTGTDTAGTTELLTRIPDATAGAAGGLPIVDANNYVAGIQGTLNQLDDLNNAAAAPSAADVADAVWDEATSGHAIVGSTGAALTAAGNSGDPWTTLLPGLYAAGTAGEIVGTIDAAIAALASSGSTITVVNAVAGGDVTVMAYDTWEFTVTNAALALTDYETLAFVVKADERQSDNEALLYLRSDAAKLVRIDGAAPVSLTNGTLTKDSATAFTGLVAMAETGGVDVGTWTWWLKGFDTTASPVEGKTVAKGTFTVNPAGLTAVA